MQAGADEAKIAEVPTWRESERFSPLERIALEYAEVITITGQRVTDELFARLRSLLDEGQIVELTAAVALENFRSKANGALQVQAQGFCALPGLQNAAEGGTPRTDSATQAQPKKSGPPPAGDAPSRK